MLVRQSVSWAWCRCLTRTGSAAAAKLFMPLTLVAAGASLAAGNWHSIAWYAGFVALLHMIISIAAIAMARERASHLLVVPIYRLIYEPLRAYLLYASSYRALKGTLVQWDKLERKNSVTVFAEASHLHPFTGCLRSPIAE